MLRRTTLPLAAAAIIFLMGGCNGPSKAGQEARNDANLRLNIINAQLVYDQARQSFGAGNFEKALRNIKIAIARYPDNVDYYILLGRIHLETHHLEPALTAFKTAAEKSPTSPEPHYYSGIVHERWSDEEMAFESYSRAAALAPGEVQYLVAAAETLIDLGRYDQAQSLLNEKLSYFEHNSAMRHLLGQIAMLKQDYPEAVDLFTAARMLSPDDLQILRELAQAQFNSGRHGQCLISVQSLRDQSAEFQPDLALMEARCLSFLDRGAEARQLYVELSRTKPSSGDPMVWIELGALAWELSDFRKVAQCGQQAVYLAPDRYEGYMLKAINEMNKDNTDAAIALLRQSCERAPAIAMPHLLLSQALKKTGDPGGAAAAFAAAQQAEPDSPFVQEQFAHVQSSQ